MRRISGLTLIAVQLGLSMSVLGQGTAALNFELDSVAFVRRKQPDRFGRAEVDLTIDIKVTNISKQTFWYDRRPATQDSLRSNLPQINTYGYLHSTNGKTWGSNYRNTFSRIPTRSSLLPGESATIHMVYNSVDLHFAPFIKFGVPVSTTTDKSPGMLWSDPIEDLALLVFDKLGVSPVDQFGLQKRVHRLSLKEYDELFKLRERANAPPSGYHHMQGTVIITDGVRQREFPVRSLHVDSLADLQAALDTAPAYPEIIGLTIGGPELAKESNVRIKLLLERLPMLEGLTFWRDTPRSRLSLAADVPRLSLLSIGEKSPDLEKPIGQEIAGKLEKLPKSLRTVSVSNLNIHPSLYRALAANQQLEVLNVGIVDDDASVLDGLTIEDFRPLRTRKLLSLYVNCARKGWPPEHIKEFDDLQHLMSRRGYLVRLLRARTAQQIDGRLHNRDTSQNDGDELDPLIIGEMLDKEFADFKAKRDDLALQVFSKPNLKLTHRQYDYPPIGILHRGKTVLLPRQWLEAWDVTEPEVAMIAEALPHFPEIAKISVRLKQRPKEFPIELFRRAKLLPDVRWISVNTQSTWPIEAIQLAAAHPRLNGLSKVSLSKEPKYEQAFRELAKLKQLKRLDFVAWSPSCFETLAALPNLETSYLTMAMGNDKPITPATREAITQLNGRAIRLGIEGFCHPSLPRALWSIESMKSLTFMAHTKGATIDDFRGAKRLEQLEYLTLHPMSVDEATRSAVKQMETAMKRKLKARTARRRRQLSVQSRSRTEPPQVTHEQVAIWIGEMAEKGHQFSPEMLVAAGDDALRAMLQQVFPQGFPASSALSQDAVRKLIDELDDEAFLVRKNATRQLSEHGKLHREFLVSSLDDPSTEVRERLRGILDSWRPPQEVATNKFAQAWKRYLENLTEYSEDKLLAEVCAEALRQGVHTSNRKHALANSLQTLARSLEPEITAPFAGLCKLDDPQPAIFAIQRLGGRSISPLHRAALASHHWDLKRAALSSMPSVHADPIFRRKVRSIVAKIFASDAKPEIAGPDDKNRDILAAIYDDVPAARAHLFQVTRSKDPDRAALAVAFLTSDENYRQFLRPDVAAMLREAAKSEHQQVRLAVAEACKTFKLNEKTLPIFLHLLDDASEEVWQTATNGLLQQHFWVRQGESKINVLQTLRDREASLTDERLRSRHQTILEVLEEKAEFGWVEWPE